MVNATFGTVLAYFDDGRLYKIARVDGLTAKQQLLLGTLLLIIVSLTLMLTGSRKYRNANEIIEEERKRMADQELMVAEGNLASLESELEANEVKYNKLL